MDKILFADNFTYYDFNTKVIKFFFYKKKKSTHEDIHPRSHLLFHCGDYLNSFHSSKYLKFHSLVSRVSRIHASSSAPRVPRLLLFIPTPPPRFPFSMAKLSRAKNTFEIFTQTIGILTKSFKTNFPT